MADVDNDRPQLIGRSASHFTRVAAMVAHELDVPFDFVPIHKLTSLDTSVYAGNPALKMPVLRTSSSTLFGTENICRKLAARSTSGARIVWPEELVDDRSRNAHELAWHGMAAQVQLVIGTQVAGLPNDNVYFVKARAGFAGALGWLDAHVDDVVAALPARTVSLFEVVLFCLIEHIRFRETMPLAEHEALLRFAETFGARPSAQRTPFRVDPRP